MSRLPRILPLVAVAIGGVVAANALAGLQGREGLFSPGPAAAEEAAVPPKAAKTGKAAAASPAKAPSAESKAASPAAAATSIRAAPAPVCAPSAGEIAKAAGLSPSELAMLQNLQNRRGQIENRERDLDTEVQLLNAAQVKLDGKLKAMNALKAEIQALMGQVDQKTQAEVDRLVQVYTKMKPGDAAAVMAQLDDKVRLPIAAAMKPAVLSAVLGKMGTLEAKVLTERLAHRYQPIQTALETPSSPAAAATAQDRIGKDVRPKAGAAKPAGAKAAAPKDVAQGAAAPSDDAAADPPAQKPKVLAAARLPAPRPHRRPAPKPRAGAAGPQVGATEAILTDLKSEAAPAPPPAAKTPA